MSLNFIKNISNDVGKINSGILGCLEENIFLNFFNFSCFFRARARDFFKDDLVPFLKLWASTSSKTHQMILGS